MKRLILCKRCALWQCWSWFLLAALVTLPGRDVVGQTSERLTALLNERREVLRKLVDAAEQRYRAGAATLEAAIRASNQLLEAELELADTKAERIAVHEKLVGNLQRLEQVAEARRAAAAAALEEVLEAKAARLKGEITLLRERQQDR